MTQSSSPKGRWPWQEFPCEYFHPTHSVKTSLIWLVSQGHLQKEESGQGMYDFPGKLLSSIWDMSQQKYIKESIVSAHSIKSKANPLSKLSHGPKQSYMDQTSGMCISNLETGKWQGESRCRDCGGSLCMKLSSDQFYHSYLDPQNIMVAWNVQWEMCSRAGHFCVQMLLELLLILILCFPLYPMWLAPAPVLNSHLHCFCFSSRATMPLKTRPLSLPHPIPLLPWALISRKPPIHNWCDQMLFNVHFSTCRPHEESQSSMWFPVFLLGVSFGHWHPEHLIFDTWPGHLLPGRSPDPETEIHPEKANYKSHFFVVFSSFFFFNYTPRCNYKNYLWQMKTKQRFSYRNTPSLFIQIWFLYLIDYDLNVDVPTFLHWRDYRKAWWVIAASLSMQTLWEDRQRGVVEKNSGGKCEEDLNQFERKQKRNYSLCLKTGSL